MKRIKTIKDHLRYYRTYGGFKPKRKPWSQEPAEAETPKPSKPDQNLLHATKRLKAVEKRVQSLENQPKPTPKDPEEARQRARDARSIRALENRVQNLEARPTTSPGLDLAKARLAAAQARRAERVKKEKNATT